MPRNVGSRTDGRTDNGNRGIRDVLPGVTVDDVSEKVCVGIPGGGFPGKGGGYRQACGRENRQDISFHERLFLNGTMGKKVRRKAGLGTRIPCNGMRRDAAPRRDVRDGRARKTGARNASAHDAERGSDQPAGGARRLTYASRLPFAQRVASGYSTPSITAWKTRQTQIGLIHPASAGHGLNIQTGGSVLVWFTVPWSLELYEQTVARLWRQGQAAETVTVVRIVAEGTIDARVVKAVEDKAMSQDGLMKAVKAEVLP